MTAVPAVVIAAPASGSGKTTVATGLIGALRAAGHTVAPFKVGPDYIDPGYHAVAAGVVGRNLDPNLVGDDLVGPLFEAGSCGADIAVVEGVMGLFDGRIVDSAEVSVDPAADGSTAHVARLIGAPVILVVDAAGHSQSLAALLHGFIGYESGTRIVGVILNRVGSQRHETVLRQACDRVGLPVFGVLRRDPDLKVPSRHLGLIPAAENSDDAVRAVAAMITAVGAALDLPAIVAAAGTRRRVSARRWSAVDAVADAAAETSSDAPIGDSGRPVVAMAGGAAFTFGYAEHRELLAAAGADVVTFDPLTDRLPAGTDAVVIGGGFPEEHAEALSANEPLRKDLAAHAAADAPILAECAGLLYLATELEGHPMAGVLDVVGRFEPTLTLGYRDAVALDDSVAFSVGQRVTGHEFHRSAVYGSNESASAWGWSDHSGRPTRHGVVAGAVHASYLHLHPAGSPWAVARFVAAARRRTARRASVG